DLRDRDGDQRRLLNYITADTEASFPSAMTSADYARVVAEGLRRSNLVVGAHLRDSAARQVTPVDLGGVVTTVAREFAHLASQLRVTIDLQRLDPGVMLQGEALFLAQALRNIFMIAMDREPAGGRVTVELRK